MKNCYNPTNAPLAQLDREASAPSGLAWPIIRIVWVTVFGCFVFLRWPLCALISGLLGQLAEIALRPTDGSCPTEGAFHTED